MVTVAEELFGKDYDSSIWTLFKNSYHSSQEDAKKVLGAIVNPELRFITDLLQRSMGDSQRFVSYDSHSDDTPNFHDSWIFSDQWYFAFFNNHYVSLIEAAHPNYRAVTSPWAAMNFEREFVMPH